jgi:hypothetical protein
MKTLIGALGVALLLVGCGNPVGVVASPYESCTASDTCSQGSTCYQGSLPVSAGFTGNLCSFPCTFDSDCPQDLTNYAAICVNSLCYIQCPVGGSTCPYGTGCVQFQDQAGNAINLCTP